MKHNKASFSVFLQDLNKGLIFEFKPSLIQRTMQTVTISKLHRHYSSRLVTFRSSRGQ